MTCGTKINPMEIKCTDLENRDGFDFSYWIGENYSTTFEITPPKQIGSISVGMLRTNDKILTNGEAVRIEYCDGTKYTINKSWFE